MAEKFDLDALAIAGLSGSVEGLTDNTLIEIGRTHNIHPGSALAFVREILSLATRRQAGEVGAGVPAGWVVVPVAPTVEMLRAPDIGKVLPASGGETQKRWDRREREWAAMLNSTPSAPNSDPIKTSAQQDEREAKPLTQFVTYLNERCIGQTITEEALTDWLLDVMDNTQREKPENWQESKGLFASSVQQVQADAVARFSGWALMCGDEFINVNVAHEGDKPENQLKKFLRGGTRSVKEAIRQGYRIEPATIVLAAHPSPAGESDKKDAERYRELRENHTRLDENGFLQIHFETARQGGAFHQVLDEHIDADVDAAMSREQSQGVPK